MKNKVLTILMELVFLIVFNVIFFVVIGTDRGATGWVCYAFIHISYLTLILTPFMVKEGKSKAVFGYPLYYLSGIYFFLELAVGVTFLLVKTIDFKIALLVQLIMFGIYLVLFIANMKANESTAAAEAKREGQLQYVKSVTLRLQSVLGTISDPALKKKVERAYDTVRTSPVATVPEAWEAENSIVQMIGQLEQAVVAGDNGTAGLLADRIIQTAEMRNRQIAMSR